MKRASTLTLALALAFGGCGGEGEDKRDSAGSTSTESPAASTPEGPCKQVEAPAAKRETRQKEPKKMLDKSKKWSVTMNTNCGSFTIDLDLDTAPNAAASMVELAEKGFFDGTVFHRIVPGFVIQGGDPTGTGSGGPGYKTVDAPPRNAAYTKGVVAMAKTGAEEAGTAGSQFFVVTGEDVGLPPDYAVLGKVSDGLDVVEAIGQLGDSGEKPTQTVTIESTEVKSG